MIDFAVATEPDNPTVTVHRGDALSVHGRFATLGSVVHLRDASRKNAMRTGKVVSVVNGTKLGITLGI
jgi:hypothetical protein